MKYAVEFGPKQIFNIEYFNRKTLGATVKSDLLVLIKAPVDKTLGKVEG